MYLCNEVQKTLDIALLKNIGILGVKEQKYYSIRYNSIRRQAKNMGTQYELFYFMKHKLDMLKVS